MSDTNGGGSLKETLWDPIAGFGVTFRTMFRKPVTEQYPFEKRPTAPRFHGRHQLNRWPDGLEKCVGCELCAWACPADAIYVEGASNGTSDGTDGGGERFSPGERYGRVYQINYLRCILCGLCIEACPTRALTMTNEYELADDNRADLIYEKSDLLAPLLPGMVDRGRGAVLNVASTAAFQPLPGQAGYGAGKAFVLSYTQSLAGELRGTGVTATTLCPGPVHTGFGERAGFSKEDAEAALPPVMWVSAEQVALDAVKGLDRGRLVVIPGRANRVAAAFAQVPPRSLLLPVLVKNHPGLR